MLLMPHTAGARGHCSLRLGGASLRPRRSECTWARMRAARLVTPPCRGCRGKSCSEDPPRRPHLDVEIEMGKQDAAGINTAGCHVDRSLACGGCGRNRSSQQEKMRGGQFAVAPE